MSKIIKYFTLDIPVETPRPLGIKTSPTFYPCFGAVLPTPFVDILP
jgi:hypothetical protein